IETKVGDRYVLAGMLENRAVLGGEDSGHIIFLDRHTTGDGLFSAVRLLSIVKKSRRPLSELAREMRVFPQVLINVRVREKTEISSLPAVTCAIRRAEEKLQESGRVLVRYSGTQSLCRVLVEGPTPALTRRVAEELARAVEEALG
ncbi:MAG: phosphoglucosamine mutase, partial [Candidatus Aureabacteria bacterium]|nr:phosphoglucosamine mutase [Candidatus Auribacterota bacterium]